jgi:hypothetical protein
MRNSSAPYITPTHKTLYSGASVYERPGLRTNFPSKKASDYEHNLATAAN